MGASGVLRAYQSGLSQLGVGGGENSRGTESSMVMGTWSDPVDGRDVSQLRKKGATARLAKEMSRTPGRVEESKRKPAENTRDIEERIAEIRYPVELRGRNCDVLDRELTM